MRQRPLPLLLLGLGILLTTVPARSAEMPGDSAKTIADLISQLGDKSFRVRQAAGKALEDRGEDALVALRQALTNDDEEVRRRVEVLTQKIERSALLSPKLVTLDMKDRPVDEVVKELAKQTGYRLQYQGGQAHKITVQMDKVTYWQALEKICNDGNLSPGFDDQQGIVYLYQQNTVSPYTSHSGPFRFVAQNFNYNRYVNLANLPRNGADPNQHNNQNNLNFGFLIQAEPKSPLLGISQPKLIKAEDENGVSLLPRLDENQHAHHAQYYDGGGMYRNFSHSTGVQMAKPAKEATTAKIIKGKVLVTILSGTKADVVIDKLAVGKKKYTGTGQTADIEVQDVVEQNKVWTITMQIKKHVKNGEQPDYNWINTVQQKLELYDAKGVKYLSQGAVNFINNTQTSVHATYQFAPPNNKEAGPATKLVLAEWLTMQHELEFEFKNLPLP